jgi:hypothetical protein
MSNAFSFEEPPFEAYSEFDEEDSEFDLRSALRRFQEQQSLPVDGIDGPETKRKHWCAKGAGNPHLLRHLRTGQRILKVAINPSPWSPLQQTRQSQLTRSP